MADPLQSYVLASKVIDTAIASLNDNDIDRIVFTALGVMSEEQAEASGYLAGVVRDLVRSAKIEVTWE